VPDKGVTWLDAVRADVEQRRPGTINDHDERIWANEPRPDERGLLRDLDHGRAAWIPLLLGRDPDEGPLKPPSAASSAALRAALSGRSTVVSAAPRPANVRVIAIVDALLTNGPTLVNARVWAQVNEVVAVAAVESVELALAGELVALDRQ
jgi:hypothetical protein